MGSTPAWGGQPRPRAIVWALVALTAALCGCGASAPTPTQPPTVVGVSIHDFHISAGATRIAAGKVTFVVSNNGPSTHEFNVDRTDLPADQLPLDSTGLGVDQSSPSLQRQGSVEALGLGTSRRLTLDLKPGHYVFYCDIPGHYLSGMHVSVDVYAN
jgi:uncharacterized cupredoxin-like copper-binding protein